MEKWSQVQAGLMLIAEKVGNIMRGHIPRILAERIVCDENILTGKPVIKGTRLAVEFIVGLLGHGWTEAEILENYPHIVQADIRACLAYASAVLHQETRLGNA